MKVLMILNHAPDYRESFLRELGEATDLTVVAQPCGTAGLTPPDTRENYRYIEIEPVIIGGAFWQPGLRKLLHAFPWDVICVNANMRNLSTIFLFYSNPVLWKRWVWWGPIFGKSKRKVLSLIRSSMIKRSACCLVYSKPVATMINGVFGSKAESFNNTEIQASEFCNGKFSEHPEIRLLFVGRNQPRKKLDRLVALAARRKDVMARLVGPGMENIAVPESLLASKKIEISGRSTGKDLKQHFDWADIVANPGHAGLLVMNAARHGKGIVVDSDSDHAPEFFLAKESGQPFIHFGDSNEVDLFFDSLHADRRSLVMWGRSLQEKAKEEYTIEYMVLKHKKVFENVLKGLGEIPDPRSS